MLHSASIEEVYVSGTLISEADDGSGVDTLNVLKNRGVNVVASNPRNDAGVLFDSYLAYFVKKELGQETLSLSDLLALDTLSLEGSGVQSLQGIEYLVNLRILDLTDCSVTDLSPITELTQLKDLRLGNRSDQYGQNEVRDLSPLKGLWRLEHLDLLGCCALDYEPLLALPSLTYVELKNALIREENSVITALENMGVTVSKGGSPEWEKALSPSLRAALLADSGHIDFNTTNIHIAEWPIDDLQGIQAFERLESLELQDCSISDISPLKGMQKLRELRLSNHDHELNGNEVSNLEVLKTLPRLERFEIEGNHVKDISPLLECYSLQDVRVDRNFLLDRNYGYSIEREVAAKLDARGVYIDLSRSQDDWYEAFSPAVSFAIMKGIDFNPLNGETISVLGNLVIEGEHALDLRCISKMLSLERLTLKNCEIESLEELSQVLRLRELSIASDFKTEQKRVTALDFLEGISQLEKLDLNGQDISDISPLLNLGYINEIDLSGNFLDLRAGSPTLDVISELKERGQQIITSDQKLSWNYILDPGLEKALRNALSLNRGDDFLISQVESLTALDASGYSITSIKGIELATHLESLDLRGNSISDLSPLQYLENLKTLRLDNDSELYPLAQNQVEDLNPIKNNTGMLELSLTGNAVSDIAPLLKFKSLDTLVLDSNPLDLDEGSRTKQIVGSLEGNGTTIIYDERYRAGFDAAVSSEELYTKEQLRTLALSGPVVERNEDGQFLLNLNFKESVDMETWLPSIGTLQVDSEGNIQWYPNVTEDLVFYQLVIE